MYFSHFLPFHSNYDTEFLKVETRKGYKRDRHRDAGSEPRTVSITQKQEEPKIKAVNEAVGQPPVGSPTAAGLGWAPIASYRCYSGPWS